MPKDDRTEKATPKRRSETRKKGQVARSVELNSALLILGIFVSFRFLGEGMLEDFSDLMRYFLQSPASYELNQKVVEVLFLNVAIFFLKLILPIALIALAIGVLASISQVGFMFTLKPLKPEFKKINPFTGWKRFFSLRSIVDLIKNVIKISIIGYLCYSIISANFLKIINTIDMDLWSIMVTIGSVIYEIGIKVGIALLIIAVIDYMYQRYEFDKNLRMTKQEVKEEHKQMEGDPAIKSRIRRRQMEVMMRRMMQAVPTADVVITNPIHLAIALKYNQTTMVAPLVVAKGQRLVAERIKEIARENNIPIIEDKPLAQSIYHAVDIDQEIPFDLYKAVAEILAYVYQINSSNRPKSAKS